MATIDIALPPDILAALTPPTCPQITIQPPKPAFSLCLPTGGAFQGIADVTKAIPDDCTWSFSILLQLPPLMASLGCFIKLLGLAKPLMDFVQAVPGLNPGKIAAAVPDLVSACADVVLCFTTIFAAIPKFIRDILHMIAKLLKCVAQEILSIAKLMSGLDISIQTAQQAGNQALLQQLQCANANAQAQAQAALGTMDMISAVLAVAEPLLGIAGVSLTIPTIGAPQAAAEVEQAANTMLSVATSIDEIATALDKLGNC